MRLLARARKGFTYANVMATIAVFIALGGTAFAAATLTGANIKDSTLTTKDVKNRSLLAVDFRLGQLPKGATGATGATGPASANGSPDTPAQVLAKLAAVDGTGSGVDADTLDGLSLADVRALRCPAGMTLATGTRVCYGPYQTAASWSATALVCGNQGGRIMTAEDAYLIVQKGAFNWVLEPGLWIGQPINATQALWIDVATPSGPLFAPKNLTSSGSFRCTATATPAAA